MPARAPTGVLDDKARAAALRGNALRLPPGLAQAMSRGGGGS